METQTPFKLTNALAAWRQELSAQPGVTEEQVRELETHLVESTADLQRRGLSEKEAFRTACQRLGSAERIAEEFVRAEPAALWRERMFWMVAGMVGIYLFQVVFVGLGLDSVPAWFHRAGFDFEWRWWNWMVTTITPFCLCWLALRVADGTLPKPVYRFLDTVGRPRWLGWGLVCVLTCFMVYYTVTYWQFNKAHPINLAYHGLAVPWPAPMALVMLLLMPLRTTVRGLWRNRILWMAVGVLAHGLWWRGSRAAVEALAFLFAPRDVVAEPWFFYLWLPLASCTLAGLALVIGFRGLPNAWRPLVQSLGNSRRLAWVLFAVLACFVAATWVSDLHRLQTYVRLYPPHSPPAVRIDMWGNALNSALLNTVWPALAAFLIVRLVSRPSAEGEHQEARE